MTFSIINRDQSVKAIRFRFQFNTADIATEVLAGSLPAGALVLSCRALIITPFNAGGTDLLAAGLTAASAADLIINGDLSAAAGTVIDQTVRALGSDTSAARNVFVQYVQTGTAVTAGDALFVLEYLEPASVTAL